MYSLLCTVYYVQFIMYSLLCTVYYVQFIMYSHVKRLYRYPACMNIYMNVDHVIT